MKFTFQFLALAMALFAVSCKSIDKEFLTKMQGELTTMESLKTSVAETVTKVTAFQGLVNAAPDGLKAMPEFQTLASSVTNFATQTGAKSSMFNDMVTKFKDVVTNYSTGKMKLEDAKKEYESISTGFKGFQESMSASNSTFASLQESFTKMTSDYEASTTLKGAMGKVGTALKDAAKGAVNDVKAAVKK